ncbi:MAG: substrate-binding domain-containing protein, partial [Clostridia bacterium]|nr:substrate-binding domain-containing protein [Clostridia bacterium]
IYAMLNQPIIGIGDKTENTNVMLIRPDNWRKIAGQPVIDEEQMAVLDGSTATVPITAELFRQFFDYTDEDVEESPVVSHSTTHEAYKNLINCEYRSDYKTEMYPPFPFPTGLILVTPPSEDEKKLAKSNNIELDLTPIASDGFVFITHKDNPVNSLTVEQIQGIYSGKIKNWKAVGGRNKKIIPFQREQNSGSQTAMEQMVMQGKKMLSPLKFKKHTMMSMGMLVDAVAAYENGPASIGYTYYYYIKNLYKNEDIKVIEINGIVPSNETFISGVYPFSTNYYAVMRGDEPEDSPARILRDYLISPKGQDVIEMAGYCRVVN